MSARITKLRQVPQFLSVPATLYTCGAKDKHGSMGHPCGRAADALTKAGVEFKVETVAGYRLLPWTRRGDVRAKIRELSGQDNVPILVREDGEVIAGSGQIAKWAKTQHAA